MKQFEFMQNGEMGLKIEYFKWNNLNLCKVVKPN